MNRHGPIPVDPFPPDEGERNEIDHLMHELETSPTARFEAAQDLLRFKTFIAVARKSHLPPKLAALLREKFPPRMNYNRAKALADAQRGEPPEFVLEP